MEKQKRDLKVLLIQLRKNTVIKQGEFSSFMRLSNLNPAQIEVWDVFEDPKYSLARLEAVDLVFVGGSSDDPDDNPYLPQNEDYPFTDNLMAVVRKIAEDNIPFFASCMGFHAAVQALGGEIVIDVPGMEKGTYLIERTAEGAHDPVFNHLTGDFMAISYHKKRAARLPEGAVNLARTEKCPYQAFRLEGKPFYAFQFHPELDKHMLASWIRYYMDKYNVSEDEVREIEEEYHETPESNELVGHFVDKLLAGKFA